MINPKRSWYEKKELIRIICKSSTGKSKEIKSKMATPNSYSVYRERLINKHIVDGNTRGYLKIRLPRFEKFVEIWGED